MKKKLLAAGVTLTLILSFSLTKAEVSPLTIDYLRGAQQSAFVTQGLAAAGETNFNLEYLNDFNGASAFDYAKAILALTAAGENPYDYHSTDFVAALESYHQNNQIGDLTLINDDFWAILALRSAGTDIGDTVIQDSKNFILNNQNNDGGWSYAPQGESDTNDTASAIMALLDSGLEANGLEIQAAIGYLHQTQNNDGGWSFSGGGESDSGSDSWVMAALYKLGENPANWIKNGHDPIGHLESLMLPDGSFTWVASNPVSNVLMTAYAAIALSESYYPVNYISDPPPTPNLHHLRIEGANQTYCDAEVVATTALNIIENGASVCGYSYVIENTEYGPYLFSINGEAAQGMSGWLYRVNWISPYIGAADYVLEEGDAVLWYFGEFTDLPLKLELSSTQTEINQEITASINYYDNGLWLPADNATVYAQGQIYTTNGAGQVILTFGQTGNFEVYAEKENHVRSNRVTVAVGNGTSQDVDLTVYIDNPGNGGNTISFTLDVGSLNFGTMQPGETASSSLNITNTGDLPIYVEATVAGADIFQDHLYLNQVLWENFSSNIPINQTSNVALQLNIPEGYGGNGQKNGNLIFWATGR